MQEGVTGVKRGQSECIENLCKGKLGRREGIKRGIWDNTPVSYVEYKDSWDLEDQSKKCKKAVNCLLASCKCKGESEPIRDERVDLPVHLPRTWLQSWAGRPGPETRLGRYLQP